jgi:hypothetical protein
MDAQGSDVKAVLDFSIARILGFSVSQARAMLEVPLRQSARGWAGGPIEAELDFAASPIFRSLRLSNCEIVPGPAGADDPRLLVNGTLILTRPSAEDLLSFDELSFFGLAFPLASKGQIEADLGGISFDAAGSKMRPGSLCAQFGLIPKRFLSSDTGSLGSRGFESLDGAFAAPKDAGEGWKALVLGLELGRFGELSDSAGFTTELAIGWSAVTGKLFAAIKLPGSDLAGRIGLQGIVGLKPREASLAWEDKPDKGRWVLCLRGVQFSVLVLTLPPNAGVDVEIGGDPSGKDRAPSWYCAYVGVDVPGNSGAAAPHV